MLDMKSKNMKKCRQKVYAIEKLCWSVETPIQQLNESQHSVCLEHIVPIFSKTTEYIDDLDYIIQHLAQVFELILMTHRYSLAYLNQNRYVLKLSN